MPRFFLYFLLFLWGLTPLAGLALSHPPDPKGVGVLQDERESIREKREALKQEVQEKRDVLKEGFQKAIQQEIREKGEAFRKEVQDKRETLRMELKEKREKFKEEVTVRKEELKKKLGERRAERIEAFFQKMVEKFEAAIGRLKKHADRIAEYLDKAEANSRGVSELRTKLADANNKILEAEKALEDAKAKYTEAVKEPDFRVAFAKVREVVHAVAEKMKEAHHALVDVVNSITTPKL